MLRFFQRNIKISRELPSDFNTLKKNRDLFKHITFYLDTENYFDYFDHLISKSAVQITTTGDITPIYAALPEEAFIEIKKGLEQRDFVIKVIFLLRDPIDRIQSMVRFNRKLTLAQNPNCKLPNEIDQIESEFPKLACEVCTRYEKTITVLEKVFDEENIFYGFYENLFDSKTLNNLKNFLEITHFPYDAKEKVNESSSKNSKVQIDGNLKLRIFDHYRDTYEYCHNKFDLTDMWSGLEFL